MDPLVDLTSLQGREIPHMEGNCYVPCFMFFSAADEILLNKVDLLEHVLILVASSHHSLIQMYQSTNLDNRTP